MKNTAKKIRLIEKEIEEKHAELVKLRALLREEEKADQEKCAWHELKKTAEEDLILSNWRVFNTRYASMTFFHSPLLLIHGEGEERNGGILITVFVREKISKAPYLKMQKTYPDFTTAKDDVLHVAQAALRKAIKKAGQQRRSAGLDL